SRSNQNYRYPRNAIGSLCSIKFVNVNYTNLSSEEKKGIRTLGALKATGYQPISVKQEIRTNLIKQIKAGQPVFEGIWGYENTVIPDVERALLSCHNINFLGLRGQAKTRMARRSEERRVGKEGISR